MEGTWSMVSVPRSVLLKQPLGMDGRAVEELPAAEICAGIDKTGRTWKSRKLGGKNGNIAPALFTALLLAGICVPVEGEDFAVNGIGIAGDTDLRRGVDLAGEWEFYSGRLLSPSDFSQGAVMIDGPAEGVLAHVPGAWSSLIKGLDPREVATYRLAIKLPDEPAEPIGLYLPRIATAYRLYCNGSLLMENGTVSANLSEIRGTYAPRSLYMSAKGALEIILQCANGEDVVAGPILAPRLGYQSTIAPIIPRAMTIDAFIYAAILMMSAYHIILSFLHPEERASLYFGLLAAILALRGGLTGARLLHLFAGGLGFHALTAAEFITVYLAGITVYLYFSHLYPHERPGFARIPILAVSAAFTAFTVFAPISAIARIRIFYEAFLLAEGILIAVWIVRSLAAKRDGAVIMLAGFAIMLGSMVHDMVLDLTHARGSFLASYAMLLFILLQAVLIAHKYALAFLSARESSSRNEAMAASYARFVPREFLSLLGKQSIESVKLGDQIEMRMTVLFADIRSFTALSEDLTPQDNFNFLNSYLSRISPVIRSSGGFIDKYLGDGIMALFPGSPEDAVRAGLRLLATVRVFNQHRENSGYRPISIGIGINTGKLMLGTVGESSRMEGTVISGAVNLASRLEGLTRTIGSWIIVSEELLAACPGADWINHRYLGHVHVKGMARSVAIHEIIDEPFVARLTTRAQFEEAVKNMEDHRPADAAVGFKAVLAEDPSDPAARYFIAQLTEARRGGIGPERPAADAPV